MCTGRWRGAARAVEESGDRMGIKREHGVLEKRIGYRFKVPARLTEALMHRSFRYENAGIAVDNERLEFLGDAVLCLLSAACVFETHPTISEGEMTAMRARVISGKALACCAQDVELGAFLRMGFGEERSGGRMRPTNLANALEAVIGAAFLDGGIRAAGKIFDKVIRPRLSDSASSAEPDNPKGMLQEYAQGLWKASPTYELISTEGPAHATVFTVRVTLPDKRTATSSGRSKQNAESAAAAIMLRDVSANGV